MKKNLFLLILIILLAGFLRLYQLGKNPPSLDWDEASLGYNAYSILKTGSDEYGRYLPLSFRSFEDYKPPLYVYLTVPSIAAFGLNEFSVRFPSAVFGTLAVLLTYFLVKELFGKEEIALLSSLFLAISPWHLQFSRVAFEANIALTLIIAGILFFLKSLKDGKFLVLSSLFFSFSLYAYHSPRLIVPALMLGFLVGHKRILTKKWKELLISGAIALLLLFPLFKEITEEGKARFSSVTVVVPGNKLDTSIVKTEDDLEEGKNLLALFHNRRIFYVKEMITGYLDHFNFDFLFLKGDPPGRHHAADFGMLYLLDLPFILIGVFYLLGKKNSWPIFWWFLIAPVASSMTTGTPHAVRAIFYLPIYQIFAALGFVSVVKFLKKFSPFIFLFYLLSFIFYLHMYYIHTPLEYSQWWQYGHKEAIKKAMELDGEKNYQKIIFTYKYDQPYIYYLFYGEIDPFWYQSNWDHDFARFKRDIGKYEFRNINWEQDKDLKNALIIGSPEEIPENPEGLLSEIKFLDGKTAFRLVERW